MKYLYLCYPSSDFYWYQELIAVAKNYPQVQFFILQYTHFSQEIKYMNVL